MEVLFENLINLLEEQTDQYSFLLSVLCEEKKAIIESDHEKLYNTNKEKEALVSTIQDLEDKRLRLLEDLAGSIGVAGKDLTLSELYQFAEEPFTSRLETCRSNLMSITEKIIDANTGNKSLLNHSIDLARGSIALLNSLMSTNKTYYRTGRVQNKDQSGRVISGEI